MNLGWIYFRIFVIYFIRLNIIQIKPTGNNPKPCVFCKHIESAISPEIFKMTIETFTSVFVNQETKNYLYTHFM